MYSTDLVFDSVFDAKKACSKIALEQGVLDFIKFGNGQTQPAIRVDRHDADDDTVDNTADPPLPSATTLQAFYESLPQPFPEPFGEKSAVEINGPAWLNVAIQAARGGKLTPTFIWVSGGRIGRMCFREFKHTQF